MRTKLVNPVLDFINTLCNFIALNILFLITCLPVVTIGAALSSLYYVTIREARGEYGYLIRPYLREFRRNLKTGTLAFAILSAIGAVLLFSLAFWYSLGTTLSAAVTGLIAIALIIWLFTFTYTFPLIGRFEDTAVRSLKNAFCLMMSNVKATLWLLLIYVVTLSLCFFLAPMKLLMVLFGFAFIAYCQSYVLKNVFEPYENVQEVSAEISPAAEDGRKTVQP